MLESNKILKSHSNLLDKKEFNTIDKIDKQKIEKYVFSQLKSEIHNKLDKNNTILTNKLSNINEYLKNFSSDNKYVNNKIYEFQKQINFMEDKILSLKTDRSNIILQDNNNIDNNVNENEYKPRSLSTKKYRDEKIDKIDKIDNISKV
jgi:hypothetical protein